MDLADALNLERVTDSDLQAMIEDITPVCEQLARDRDEVFPRARMKCQPFPSIKSGDLIKEMPTARGLLSPDHSCAMQFVRADVLARVIHARGLVTNTSYSLRRPHGDPGDWTIRPFVEGPVDGHHKWFVVDPERIIRPPDGRAFAMDVLRCEIPTLLRYLACDHTNANGLTRELEAILDVASWTRHEEGPVHDASCIHPSDNIRETYRFKVPATWLTDMTTDRALRLKLELRYTDDGALSTLGIFNLR